MHGKLDNFSNFNTSRIGLTLCGYAHMWGWEATFYTLAFRFLNTLSCNFVSVCVFELWKKSFETDEIDFNKNFCFLMMNLLEI